MVQVGDLVSNSHLAMKTHFVGVYVAIVNHVLDISRTLETLLGLPRGEEKC